MLMARSLPKSETQHSLQHNSFLFNFSCMPISFNGQCAIHLYATGTCDTRSGDLVFFSAAFWEFSLFIGSNSIMTVVYWT